MEKKHTQTITRDSIGFIVGEKPIALHGMGLEDFDLSYLEGVNPEYWKYPYDLVEEKDVNSINSVEATYLRVMVSQNIESVLAMFFATIQAPKCVTGWLSKYTMEDLRILIRKLENGEHIHNRLGLIECSWESVVRKIWGLAEKSQINQKIIALRHLCTFFLSPSYNGEYNALKHGFRSRNGGMQVSFAPSNNPNEIPDSEEFITLGDSKFGSMLMKLEKIDKVNFTANLNQINWDISELKFLALHTYAVGNNIVKVLRKYRGLNDKGTYLAVTLNGDNENYIPKDTREGLSFLDLCTEIDTSEMSLYTAEQIEKSYPSPVEN